MKNVSNVLTENGKILK